MEYGSEYLTVDPDGAITFRLLLDESVPFNDPDGLSFVPGGAQIKYGFKATSASFCADIKTAAGDNPGAIFALYATSGEPKDRETDLWDELDVEFLGQSNDKMWVNYYHNGPVPGWYGENRDLGFSADDAFHNYCLDWDLASQFLQRNKYSQ